MSKRLLNLLINLNNNRRVPSKKEKIGIETAKTIGIIYHCSFPADDAIIQQYIELFKSQGKNVYSIEYLEKNNNLDFKLKEPGHFFLKEKELNILGLPRQRNITGFIGYEFDILLNLSVKSYPVLQFLVSKTNADLKAGFLNKNYEESYDFLVNIGQEVSYKEAVESILDYLKLINKP